MERIRFVQHKGKSVLTAISRFSGRPFNTFSDRRTAMDWLVAQ